MSQKLKPASIGPLTVASLFAGVGGIDLGLHRAGHQAVLLCENNPHAQAVLESRFHGTHLHSDVRELTALPRSTDLVAAGFPCQDLSPAGRTAGIFGSNSGLIREVFRLVEGGKPPLILLENVPFMLRLGRGRAMEFITTELMRLGYDWAYRIIDVRAFGIPQRRLRVFLLASNTIDPRGVILTDNEPEPDCTAEDACSFGFYWTEGNRGIGWVQNAVPALKGGSGLGIPSAPAIIMPSGEIVTPHLVDAERMQGFPDYWTAPATESCNSRYRWKLIGNAVNVRVSEWIGKRLISPKTYQASDDKELRSSPWPNAAYSRAGVKYVANVGPFPVRRAFTPVHDFLRFKSKPLSLKAASGVLQRLIASNLAPDPILINALQGQVERMKVKAA